MKYCERKVLGNLKVLVLTVLIFVGVLGSAACTLCKDVALLPMFRGLCVCLSVGHNLELC